MRKTIIAMVTVAVLLAAMMPAVFAGEDGQVVAIRNLKAPKTVKAKAVASNKITVTWSKCESATAYKVYYYNTKKKAFLPCRNHLKGTSCTLKGITPGKKYYFKVRALEYMSSELVANSTLSKAASARTKLNAPAKIKASTQSNNNIIVSWKKVKGAKGYVVFRYNKSKKKFSYAGKTSASVRSFTDKKTSLNKKYYYKVCAFSTEKKYADKTYKKGGKTVKKTVTSTVKHAGKFSKIVSAKTKSYKKKMICKITAYCDSGYTASGLAAGRGKVAVDPSVIKLGSKMYVSGYGNCVAADTGGAVKGNFVDIWLPSEGACGAWGVRYKMVYVY